MIKYCHICGAELFEGTKFCASCGSIFEEKPATPVQPLREPMPDGNISQQQPPIYTPMQQPSPHKSKNKLIFAVVAVVAVAIVVVVALFFIMQGNSANDGKKFIGTWDVSSSMYSINGSSSSMGTWTFYENGSLKMASPSSYNYPSISFEQNDTLKTLTVTGIGEGYASWATYKVEGGKLKFTYIGAIGSSSTTPPAMSYRFSNDNTCTLTYTLTIISIPITLTRTSDIGTGQISTAWENINITADTYGTSVHGDWISLTRSYVHYSGTHAPSEWGEVTIGDVIQIGVYDQYLSGRITWIPTDSTIEYFWFYT